MARPTTRDTVLTVWSVLAVDTASIPVLSQALVVSQWVSMVGCWASATSLVLTPTSVATPPIGTITIPAIRAPRPPPDTG